MKKTKRKSKIIFSVCVLLILVSMMVLPSFAIQAGYQPYDEVTDLNQALPYYAIPTEQAGASENQYTLIIDTESLLTYSSQAEIIFEVSLIQLGTDIPPVDHQLTVTITQSLSTYEKQVRIYDWNLEQTLLQITILSQDHPYILIPFKYSSGSLLSYSSVNFVQIYNNEQYQTAYDTRQDAYRDGYNQGEQDATDFLEAGKTIIISAVEAPFNVVRQMLNFEILGINVFGFVMALFTIALVTAVIKFIV